jgi:hypothetical protein
MLLFWQANGKSVLERRTSACYHPTIKEIRAWRKRASR